jgi:hypothetical protein
MENPSNKYYILTYRNNTPHDGQISAVALFTEEEYKEWQEFVPYTLNSDYEKLLTKFRETRDLKNSYEKEMQRLRTITISESESAVSIARERQRYLELYMKLQVPPLPKKRWCYISAQADPDDWSYFEDVIDSVDTMKYFERMGSVKTAEISEETYNTLKTIELDKINNCTIFDYKHMKSEMDFDKSIDNVSKV